MAFPPAFWLFWLAVLQLPSAVATTTTTTARLCDPLPNSAHENCRYGGCCHQAINDIWADAWTEAQKRSGLPSTIIANLSRAEPVGKALGVSDLLEQPVSKDVLENNPLKLYLHLHINRISAINQKAQNFKMQYKLKWVWRDCRTLFNCSESVTVNDEHAAFRSFWQPRWDVPEMEEEEYHMIKKEFDFIGNGMSMMSESRVGTFRCSFEFKDLPFDKQKCKLHFNVPGSKSDKLTLHWLEVSSDELTNAEWKISNGPDWLESESIETDRATNYDRRSRSYSQLTAEFTLKRDSGFLLNNFLVPVVLFYLLSYIGLWLDINAVPARVAAGVIPVLTTSNKMNSLASVLPPISYPTRLGRLMYLNLFLITIHFVEYGMVHWASKKFKAMNEKKKVDDDVKNMAAEDGETIVLPEEPLLQRIEKNVVILIHRYLEFTMRILSPTVYIITTISSWRHCDACRD